MRELLNSNTALIQTLQFHCNYPLFLFLETHDQVYILHEFNVIYI